MHTSLERFLEESGHFNASQIDDAHRTQQFFGGSLLSNMVRLGYVTERQAGDYFSEWSGYPYIAYRELKNLTIPAGVLGLLTPAEAARRQVVPFLMDDGRLHVATCRADNAIFFHELERQHGIEVVPNVTPDERLELLLEQHYGVPVTHKEGMRATAIQADGDPPPSPTDDRPSVEEHALAGMPSDIGLDGLPLDSEEPAPTLAGHRIDQPFAPDTLDPARLAPRVGHTPHGEESTPSAAFEFDRAEAEPTVVPTVYDPPLQGPTTNAPVPRASATAPARDAAPPAAGDDATAVGKAASSRLRRLADKPLIALSRALDRETIGEAAVALVLYLGARRVALLGHQEERLVGWHAGGAGVTLTRFRRLSLPLYTPSIFAVLKVNAAPYIGIVPDQPANQELLNALGGVAPKIAAVVPVMLKGRLAAVIYADGGPDASEVLDLKQFQDAASKLSLSLEILLLRKKIGATHP